MTTNAELKKSAKTVFTPAMAQHGFELGKRGFKYFRKVGEIYHFVMPTIVGGDQMKVYLVPFVPEVSVIYDMKNFPENIIDVVRANLGHTRVEFLGGAHWPVATEEERQESFQKVLAALDRHGFPWLGGIATREALAECVFPSEETDVLGNNTKDLILRRATPILPA